ncbi:hypothetical protein LTS12_027490, partial [Elasticomyces elasticus]
MPNVNTQANIFEKLAQQRLYTIGLGIGFATSATLITLLVLGLFISSTFASSLGPHKRLMDNRVK